MGLKSGSRDAGLDESDEAPEERAASDAEDTAADTRRAEPEPAAENEGDDADATGEEPDAGSEEESESERPTMESIPYKLRREKVNEGREQVPYFLREEVIDAETELHDRLEELLDEKVYKSDYREAAMVVAQRNPALIADVLREWGYDLKER